MCGLILSSASVPDSLLIKAMDKMSYRGLNGESGIADAGGWKLGHVRLPIQNTGASGRQPFSHGPSMIAFVGEFFTHAGEGEKAYLSRLLESDDYHGFHEVDGFWAVVRIKGTVAEVFTDYLSVKPLYVWPDRHLVCSELDPMFQLYPKPEVNRVYLSNCIKFGYDYSGATPYEGIFQIAPGTRLSWDSETGSFQSGRYWNWRKVSVRAEDVKIVVDQALAHRLISDRRVALLLSGGLDSSIIYYSLQEQGLSVDCFSLENGESEYLPPGVTPLPLPPLDLKEAVSIMQAPVDLGSLVPQIQLAKAVHSQGYHVCLTGDGADELFGGYARAQQYDSQASDVFCELPYYHLPRLDRTMMRFTVELRSPFIAPKVVAAALNTPRPDRTMKQALKSAYAAILPPEILNRPKLPLKTSAVKLGGVEYRHQLVKEFLNAYQSL